MSKKIWNLMYVVGNPAMFSRVTSNADNPCSRKDALEGANTITNNGGGWRTWVEHKDTGERIFESPSEIAHRTAAENATKPEAVRCETCEGQGALPPEGESRALGCLVCHGSGKLLSVGTAEEQRAIEAASAEFAAHPAMKDFHAVTALDAKSSKAKRNANFSFSHACEAISAQASIARKHGLPVESVRGMPVAAR